MVLDTSALVAILSGETEQQEFIRRIEQENILLLSAASYVETGIVIDSRYGPDGTRDLKLFLAEAEIDIAPVTVEQAEIALDAFRTFGKGRHAASLNYGDCFSYALSKATGEALLFKGDDFSQTDVAALL